MPWDFITKLFSIKPVEKPDFEAMKLAWNDATKIESRVREIVASELEVDIARVVPEADWYADFGCSLDVVELFMVCEEEFGIEIPDEEAERCPTVGGLTAYIQRQFGVEPRESDLA